MAGDLAGTARSRWPIPTFKRQAGGPTAYVKIAEGCNMSCAFSAIPGFKGAQRSK